jgi:hypothetical protein
MRLGRQYVSVELKASGQSYASKCFRISPMEIIEAKFHLRYLL